MEHLVLSLLETRRGRVVVAAFTVLVGGVFAAIAWPDVRGSRRLKLASARVDADVVETRVSRDQHGGKSYDVRYRFRTAVRGPWYTREERGTNRSDLWSELPKDEWDRARASGRLPVVYDPDEPRINCPASMQSSAATDATAGLVTGVLLLGGGSLWLVRTTATMLWTDTSPVAATSGMRRRAA